VVSKVYQKHQGPYYLGLILVNSGFLGLYEVCIYEEISITLADVYQVKNFRPLSKKLKLVYI
jgi:hypothetical protein